MGCVMQEEGRMEGRLWDNEARTRKKRILALTSFLVTIAVVANAFDSVKKVRHE
jgi:hypothetical protein